MSYPTDVLSARIGEVLQSLASVERHADEHRHKLETCNASIARLKAESASLISARKLLEETK